MSVDKFGRHQDFVLPPNVRGPPGEGFYLTSQGHYDMKNKLVRNMGTPKADSDATNLHFIRKHCVMKSISGNIDFKGKLLRNVSDPILPSDSATMAYVQTVTPILAADNWNFGDKRLSAIKDPLLTTDAVNLKTLQKLTPSIKDSSGNYDASNLKIINLTVGTSDTDAVNVKFVRDELLVITTGFEKQLEKFGAALFHYIHRHGSAPPSNSVNNKNYLPWHNILGKSPVGETDGSI
jgi:hypothetical protein